LILFKARLSLFLTVMGVLAMIVKTLLNKKTSFRDYNTVEAQNGRTKLLAVLRASCMPLKD